MGKREMKSRMVSWIMTVCMIVTLFSGISFVTAADVSAAEQADTGEMSEEQADTDEVSAEQTGTDELSAGQTDASGGISVQTAETEEKEFVHPGLMHTQKSIDAIRQNLADGDAVTTQAYQALCGDGFSSASWGGRPLQDVVRGGSGDNRAQMYIDIERAYQNALLWKLGAGEEHGEAAVRILNGWSHTMKTLSGTADRFLAAGIYGYQMANAAELVRDREDFDKEAMDTLLLNVFYPLNHDFLVGHNGSVISNYWANWDLCNIASTLAIGIFCDRTDIYEEAVTYYQNGAGNGSLFNTMPYTYEDGLAQWQEAGRDQGHTTLGISLCGAINEMAWSQGLDLYGLSDNRLLKAAEYVAKYNNTAQGEEADNVPFSSYSHFNSAKGHDETNTGVSASARGQRRPVYTAIYNHYVNRMGLEAPELKKVLYPDDADPIMEGGQRNGDEPGWQSVTFNNISTREEGKDAAEVEGPLEDGIYRIYSNAGGCMTDSDGTLSLTAKSDAEEQWWKLVNSGDGEYTVINAKTGRVLQLDADSYTSGSAAYTEGTKFVLSDSVTGAWNQRIAFLQNYNSCLFRIASAVSSHIMNKDFAQVRYVSEWDRKSFLHKEWYVEKKESKDQIAWFDFSGETEGLSGSGAVALPEGTPVFTGDEERKTTVQLSGSQYLKVQKEDGTALFSGEEALTVSCYSRTDGSGTDWLFYAAADENGLAENSYLGIYRKDGRIYAVRCMGGITEETNVAAADAQEGWNHIVAVFGKNQIQLYVNGSRKAAVKNNVSNAQVCGENGVVTIGGAALVASYTGELDDYAIYNYAMTASEVKALEDHRLVAQFTFDDEVDGFHADNAKAVNSQEPTLTEDAHSGKALKLDGSNYLSVTDTDGSPLLTGWDEMTVSYWSKVDTNGTNWIFYAAPDDLPQVYCQENYVAAAEKDGTLMVERYKNTTVRPPSISEAVATKNVWKQITVTVGKNSTAVYVNGVLVSDMMSAYRLSDILGENSVFYLGKANWGKQGEYSGVCLDDVRIYNYALNAAEVAREYTGYPAAKQEQTDATRKEAVQNVIDKIHAIGTVEATEESHAKIVSAREAYDALEEADQVLVSNYALLQQAEYTYKTLAQTEKKQIALFTFDDTDTGFSSEGASAVCDKEPSLTRQAVKGKALRLGGSSTKQRVRLLGEDQKSLLDGCSAVTVSYWGKTYSTGANWGFYAAPSERAQVFNKEKYLGIYDSGTRIEAIRYYNNGSRGKVPAGEAEYGEWRFITAVYGESSTTIYINGEKAAEVTGQDSLQDILGTDSVAYLGMANWGSGEYYNGVIDEVGIYNYALDADEIRTLYESYGTVSAEKTCLAAFDFDDMDTGFSSTNAKADKVGTVTLADSGFRGKALQLDGTGAGYLSVTDPDGASLLKDCDELTVSYWGRMDTEETTSMWTFFAAPDDAASLVNKEIYLGILDTGKQLSVQRFHNTGSRAEGPEGDITDTFGNWKHVTVTFAHAKTTVYVDGQILGEPADSSYSIPEILGENGIVYIGKATWGSGEYYKGLLDDFAIYNYAMTAEEALAEYTDAKETAEKEENDLAAAKETEEKIAAIGTVAYMDESLGKIKEARNSYDGLSEEQKELVGNYQLLTEAEAEYARLKEEAEKDTEEPEPTPDPTPDPTPTPTPDPTPEPTPTPTPDTDAKDDNGTTQEPSDDGGTGTDNTQTADSTDDTSDAEDTLWQLSPSAETTTASVTAANTDKGDPKGSSFAVLQPKAVSANRSVKLSWKKLSQADGYLVYGAACGKKMKLLADVSASAHSYQHKKLKKGTYYKYIIAAYKKKGSEKRTIATSVSVHAATAGGKYSNPTAIKPVSGRKLTLKCKKSKTLQLTVKSSGKVRVHIAKIRYESDNEKIAAVSRKGKVTAKAKGSCTVYAYTQNGFCQKIKVIVK